MSRAAYPLHRARVGHSGPRTGDIAPGAGPCYGHLAPVFDSILPEHRAGFAAQRACTTKYVFFLLPSLRLQRSSESFASYLYLLWIVPPEVLKLKGRRDELGQTDCESDIRKCSALCGRRCRVGRWLIDPRLRRAAVNFSEYGSLPSGQVSLVNRIKYVACLPHPWVGGGKWAVG
jgi:hypothetical protein